MKSLISLLLLCHLQAYSQKSIPPLKIGDKLPPELLTQYKGKLIILDFWGVYCSTCIAAFPKMDSLQKKFNDKLQIVLITKNDSSAVASLFKKIKIRKPDLPSLVSDSLYSRLFPYKGVPHHVWIDSSGQVLYITDGFNADENNIGLVLQGDKIYVDAKKDFLDFDFKESLIKEGNGRLLGHLLFHSVFLGYVPGARSSGQIIADTLKGVAGLKFTNYPLQLLYSIAFEETFSPVDFNNNRTILEVSDTNRFKWPSASSEVSNWRMKNVFSYEAIGPFNKRNDMFKRMQNDLNLYLPYKAQLLSRKTTCLVLVKIPSINKIKSKGSKVSYKANQDGIHVRNLPIKNSLLLALKAQNYGIRTPIIDSTNYWGNIDIDVKCKLRDIPAVQRELRKYNLDLVEKEIRIPMLVIKDQ